MNRIFNFFSLQFILLILLTMLTAKLIILIILYFIDAKPINEYKISQTPIYQYYRFDYIFSKKINPKKTKITHNIKTNPNILKKSKLIAIYEDGDNSIAMINYKNKTYVLKINELFQGYKITKIYSDRIFLEKDKNLYMLTLAGVKTPKIKKTKPKIQSNQDNFIAIDKEKINYFQKNFQDIWQNIGIQEIYKYGRLQGYKVTFIRKNSYFAHIGLKVGDIITKINDKRLKSNADVFYFYKNIDKFDSLKLTVIRNNKEINLEFALE